MTQAAPARATVMPFSVRVVDALTAWALAALVAGLTAAACWMAWVTMGAAGGRAWWWPAAGLAFGLGLGWGRRWVLAGTAGVAACAAILPVATDQVLAAAVGIALGSLAGLTALGIARDLRPQSGLLDETRRTVAAGLLAAAPLQATAVALAAVWTGDAGLRGALHAWLPAWLAAAAGIAAIAPLAPGRTSGADAAQVRREAGKALRCAGPPACALVGVYAGLAAFGAHDGARAAWMLLVPLAAACAFHWGSRVTAALLVGTAAAMEAARGTVEHLAPGGPPDPAAGWQPLVALLCAGVVAQWAHALAAERREALARLDRLARAAAPGGAPGTPALLDAPAMACALNACLSDPNRGGLGLIGIQWAATDAAPASRRESMDGGPAAASTSAASMSAASMSAASTSAAATALSPSPSPSAPTPKAAGAAGADPWPEHGAGSVARLLVQHPNALLVARLAPGRHAMVLAADSVAQVRAAARRLYAQLQAATPQEGAAAALCIGGLLIEPQASIDADDGLGALAEAIALAGSVRDPRLFVEPLSQTMIDARRAHRDKIEHAREAIRSARLELYAQPLDDATRTGGPIDYEILTRLRDRDGSLIPPADFLPLAAQTHESGALDRAVIGQVFAWLAAHPQALARTGRCSINLADATLDDPSIAAYARAERERRGIARDKIVFELTEGGVLRNPAAASRLVDELKAAGFGVALDDFGRGLATFEYLKRFPLDYVKIDGAFIRNLATSPIDEEIVQATIRVARRLQVRTVAEHVHSQRVLDKLRQLGVDHVQGVLIGPPRPLHELFGLPAACAGEPAAQAGAWPKPDLPAAASAAAPGAAAFAAAPGEGSAVEPAAPSSVQAAEAASDAAGAAEKARPDAVATGTPAGAALRAA